MLLREGLSTLPENQMFASARNSQVGVLLLLPVSGDSGMFSRYLSRCYVSKVGSYYRRELEFRSAVSSVIAESHEVGDHWPGLSDALCFYSTKPSKARYCSFFKIDQPDRLRSESNVKRVSLFRDAWKDWCIAKSCLGIPSTDWELLDRQTSSSIIISSSPNATMSY